jgi:hypothetical protein
MDPISLASLTAAVSVLGNELLKGMATEAGKSAWTGIKTLFEWTSDPVPAEIPEKVAAALTTSPDIAEKLLELLKSNQTGTATAMVAGLEVHGGKVIIANTIGTIIM